MYVDIKNMYLATPMDYFGYMWMKHELIPERSWMLMICIQKLKMDMLLWILDVVCMTCHKLGFW